MSAAGGRRPPGDPALSGHAAGLTGAGLRRPLTVGRLDNERGVSRRLLDRHLSLHTSASNSAATGRRGRGPVTGGRNNGDRARRSNRGGPTWRRHRLRAVDNVDFRQIIVER
uniref:Uncharacterized protein n=1 Tax=Zea mays TaxID=4577 RepID=A0A804NJB7_MAIZE